MQHKLCIVVLLCSVSIIHGSHGQWDESKFLFGKRESSSSLDFDLRGSNRELSPVAQEVAHTAMIKTSSKQEEKISCFGEMSDSCDKVRELLEECSIKHKSSDNEENDEVINFHAVEENCYHRILIGAYALACYGGLWLNSYCNLGEGRCSQDLSDGSWALGVSGGVGLILGRARIEGWI